MLIGRDSNTETKSEVLKCYERDYVLDPLNNQPLITNLTNDPSDFEDDFESLTQSTLYYFFIVAYKVYDVLK